MTGPTHVISGLAITVAIGRIFGITPDGVGLLAMIIGSLAPDIDGGGTITRPGTIFRKFLGRKLARVFDGIFRLIGHIIRAIFGHRGFIHAPLIGIIFLGLALIFQQTWLAWFGCGYLCHLAGDIFTVEGIPVLSPFSTKKINLGHMRTKSAAEAVVAVILLVFVLVAGWPLLPENVKSAHREMLQKFTRP